MASWLEYFSAFDMCTAGKNNEMLINYEMVINVIVDILKFNGFISHHDWSLWQRKLLFSCLLESKEEKKEVSNIPLKSTHKVAKPSSSRATSTESTTSQRLGTKPRCTFGAHLRFKLWQGPRSTICTVQRNQRHPFLFKSGS